MAAPRVLQEECWQPCYSWEWVAATPVTGIVSAQAAEDLAEEVVASADLAAAASGAEALAAAGNHSLKRSGPEYPTSRYAHLKSPYTQAGDSLLKSLQLCIGFSHCKSIPKAFGIDLQLV